jgi:hypothetical protein
MDDRMCQLRPVRAYAEPMTTKADFTEEEWTRLKRAPFVAGMAISFADPGGPIEALKETAATLRTVLEAAQSGGHGELVDAVAREVAEEANDRKNPLAGFKPEASRAREQIVEELEAVNRIVSEKASPEEAEQFREWLLTAAQRAADSAKEGGFLGFRAERVSEGEQQMLAKLREVLSAPAA